MNFVADRTFFLNCSFCFLFFFLLHEVRKINFVDIFVANLDILTACLSVL